MPNNIEQQQRPGTPSSPGCSVVQVSLATPRQQLDASNISPPHAQSVGRLQQYCWFVKDRRRRLITQNNAVITPLCWICSTHLLPSERMPAGRPTCILGALVLACGTIGGDGFAGPMPGMRGSDHDNPYPRCCVLCIKRAHAHHAVADLLAVRWGPPPRPACSHHEPPLTLLVKGVSASQPS